MLFHEIEALLKTVQLTHINLRVAIYVRVSTESDTQLSSVVNQSEYYTEMVMNNPNWTLVDVYADEGITGMSVKKREQFNRMIADAKEGKFDLIITKMVSRFARNTLDAIKYARELRQYNVGVWFHQDGVLTFESDSEFKLTLMAAMAQNESEKKSVAVKFGLQQAIKKGVVFGFDNMWGYRKKNGRLYIDPREEPLVRTVFELYATDRYSLKQLENVLWDMGYKNRKGGKLNHVTLAKIIRNPKYKGVYAGHKVMQTDIFEKKFIELPKEQWVTFDAPEIIPPIVSKELWEAANEVLERRSVDVKNRQNLCNRPNLMTGKIRCVHCGRTYHRKDSGHGRKNVVSTWICAGKIQNGAASCPAKYLYEDELKHVLFELFQDTSEDLEKYMRYYEMLFVKMYDEDGVSREREAVVKELEKIKRKKNKLLQYNAEGEITDEEFIEMKREIDIERKEQEQRLMKLNESLNSKQAIDERLKEIRRSLEALQQIDNENMINDVFVRNYIDVIDAEVIDGVPHLTIKLVTGAVVEREITSLHPGTRSKRLVEQAERAMSNQQG